MALHPDKAALWTRLAQAGALGAIGVAAAVGLLLPAVLPDPEEVVPTSAAVDRPLIPAATGGKQSASTHSDWTTVAPLLAWATPESTAVTTVVDPGKNGGDGGGDTPLEAPVGPVSTWRYLGAVRKPSGNLALVTIDGRQRFIAEGDKIGEVEIQAVLPDRLRVRTNGATQEVRLLELPALPYTLSTGPAAPRPGRSDLDPQQLELERRLQEEAQRDRAERDAEQGGRRNPSTRPKSR